MCRSKILSLAILSACFSPLRVNSFALHNEKPTARIIEDFQDEEVAKFPRIFGTYPFLRGSAQRVYRIKMEDGNKYLNALDSQDISVQIFREFHWTIADYPLFSWSWRARALPAGGDESKTEANDSACGLYVVFGKYTGTAIKYVWSSTLPVGTVLEKKPGQFFIIVKESGEKHKDQWQPVTVNVLEDYLRLFKHKPDREPSGFGILTDGNALHTRSSCDYDDFVILHPEEKENP